MMPVTTIVAPVNPGVPWAGRKGWEARCHALPRLGWPEEIGPWARKGIDTSAAQHKAGIVLTAERYSCDRAELQRSVASAGVRGTLAFGLNPGEYTYWHDTVSTSAGLPPGTEQYSFLHSKGGNFALADGHAEYRKAAALRAWHFGLTDGSTGRAQETQSADSRACYKGSFSNP